MSDGTGDVTRRLTEAIGRVIAQTLNSEGGTLTSNSGQHQSTLQQNSNDTSAGEPAATGQRQIMPRQTTLGVSSSNQHLSVIRQLPSLFGGITGGKKRKRSSVPVPKPGKVYTKDVVCLPPSKQTNNIPIPRGNKKARLAEMGLIGKVSLNATWQAEEVYREITSVFARAFKLGDGDILPYDYMGITKGTKKLSIPQTSQSFVWNAPEVLSNCSQGCMYIMAKVEPACKGSISSDEDFDEVFEGVQEIPNQAPLESTIAVTEKNNDDDIIRIHPLSSEAVVTTPNSYYSSYVNLLCSDPIELSDDENNDIMQTAIENSLQFQQSNENENKTVDIVLMEHVTLKMVGQPHDVDVAKNLINIRRKFVLQDGIAKISRSRFDPSRPLSVKFADELGASEGAVDLGGPTREFLRLAIQEAFSTNAFIGTDSSKVIVTNQEAKRKNLYFHCGQLLAISLCNGGSVGRCLAPCLYDFVVYGENVCQPSVNDVPQAEVKMWLHQMANSDERSFNDLVKTDFAIDCFDRSGYHGVPKFETKEQLLKELCYFFVIDVSRSAIEEFKNGLRTLDVLDLLKRHSELFRPYFCFGSIALTAKYVDEIFEPKFSEEGCMMREREELVIMHWRDYLQDCEDATKQSSDPLSVTLSSVLIFATGASEVPPLGFRPKPTINFWNDVRPRSNTCGNILYLPLHSHKDDVDYDSFKELMSHAILNSPTFGLA